MQVVLNLVTQYVCVCYKRIKERKEGREKNSLPFVSIRL